MALVGLVLALACENESIRQPNNQTIGSTESTTTANRGEDRILRVPGDHRTVGAAIAAARGGDRIRVAPGVYYENLSLEDKSLTLESEIEGEAVLDGSGETVITIRDSPGSKITGFVIRNGDDGISAQGEVEILKNRFIGNKDAIDYEDGGGICRDNLFEENRDDAIDLDGACAVLIENNIIRRNGNDGIEIRLHPYSGPLLTTTIMGNLISGNEEDGIQWIGYNTETNRNFRVVRNLIVDNRMAGLGLMGDMNTDENYEGAPLRESILVLNNTISGNAYGISGGGKLVALNNLFVRCEHTALSRVGGVSQTSHNLFWLNGRNWEKSNVDEKTSLVIDPELTSDLCPGPDSPALDAGHAAPLLSGISLFKELDFSFSGLAPDIGHCEIR